MLCTLSHGPLLNRLASINPEWSLAAALIREMRLGPASPLHPFLHLLRKHPPPGTSLDYVPVALHDTGTREQAVGLGAERAEYTMGKQSDVWIPRLSRAAIDSLDGTFAADYMRAWERVADEGWVAVEVRPLRIWVWGSGLMI
jgi:hypothetical protein